MSTPDTAETEISERARSLVGTFADECWDGGFARLTPEYSSLIKAARRSLESYIASLEADRDRLTEERKSIIRDLYTITDFVGIPFEAAHRLRGVLKLLQEAADAEILRRSNIGDTNGK